MRIFELDKPLAIADGVLALKKTADGMPLSEAVADLAALIGTDIPWALCGGLAVGVHARPRGTEDVDLVLEGEGSLDGFVAKLNDKFRRTRVHAVVHKRSGVEVEMLTPEFLSLNSALVAMAIKTAKPATVGRATIPVVSREGLVALKLGRGDYQDVADIAAILKAGDIDLSRWPLSAKGLGLLDEVRAGLSGEAKPLNDETL